MDLKRMAILMLVLAVVCGLIAYESYRFNAVAVEKMLANVDTEKIFSELKPELPPRAKVAGFCAVMFGVAGLKLFFSSRRIKSTQGTQLSDAE